jgi:hypothetical protein
MQTVIGGVPDFEPFMRYQEFEDFHIRLIVFLRVVEFFDQRLVRHEFIKKLHKRYRAGRYRNPLSKPNCVFKRKRKIKAVRSLELQ